MTQRRHQIIDRLPATADDEYVVLFDFDEWFTLGQGTNVGPPEMLYATSSTFLNDGENIDASAFGNRRFSLKLTAFRGNAEDQAEPMQLMGRLLADPRGQWFLWQDEGTVNPRYFRTHPTTFSVEDLLLLSDPKRTISLDIPAKPFAFGDLVESTFTVTNDPTTGVCPMVIEIDDVAGDVPAPVWMSIDYSDTALVNRNLVVAASATDEAVDAGIVLIDAGALVAGSGWNRAVVADVTAIGGSLVRFTRVGATEVAYAKASVPGVERGDYRILVRVRGVYSAPGAVSMLVYPGIADTSTPFPGTVSKGFPVRDTWQWVDCGIARFPGGAPTAPELGETDVNLPMLSTVVAGLQISNVAGTSVDVNKVALIPAGLDRAQRATMLRAQQAPSFVDGQVWLDGINDQTNLVRDDNVGGTSTLEPLIADGDTPSLVPGQVNRIFVVPHTFSIAQANEADDKTDTVEVTLKHRPQYLYGRSATG